jgi:hypothetical protein
LNATGRIGQGPTVTGRCGNGLTKESKCDNGLTRESKCRNGLSAKSYRGDTTMSSTESKMAGGNANQASAAGPAGKAGVVTLAAGAVRTMTIGAATGGKPEGSS